MKWVVSIYPEGESEPWVTTADCVAKFNALYGTRRTHVPLNRYLKTASDEERHRVSRIVNWKPPRHRFE